MSLKKSTLYALTALFLVVLGSVPATAAPERNRYSDDELPLGRPGLDETRITERVAPGVTYTRIERGEQSEEDFYTVDVAFKADRATAESLAEQLRTDGYEPRVETVSRRAPDDPERGPLGYLVRTGNFETEAEANELRTQLTADGYAGRVHR